MRAIPLARSARRRLHLEPPVLDASGTLDARDTAAARRVAARLNAPRQAAAVQRPHGELAATPPRAAASPAPAPGAGGEPPIDRDQPPVGAGDIVALAALNAVLHQVVEAERRNGTADLRSAVLAAEE
ncbi:MAG TPA: hypothetical protein VGI98_00920, partial [Candidatus Limnocylindrales bacterium]